MLRQKLNKDGTIEYIELTPEEEADVLAERQEELESRQRQTAIEAIKAEGLKRITTLLPDVDTFDEVKTLAMFGPAFQLSATGTAVKDVYVYARNRASWCLTAPIADVLAYDPTTDSGWPS